MVLLAVMLTVMVEYCGVVMLWWCGGVMV
jgi:hypothetical protein